MGMIRRGITYLMIFGAGYGARCLQEGLRAYDAVFEKAKDAPLVDFDVPEDGSVSLNDCALGEGIDSKGIKGYFERDAYNDAVRKTMFGEDAQTYMGSTSGDVTVMRMVEDGGSMVPYNQTIERDNWRGGLPLGWTVKLRDYNGDGNVGPMNSGKQGSGALRKLGNIRTMVAMEAQKQRMSR